MRQFPVTLIVPIYCKTQTSLVWLDECLASAIKTGAQVSIWDDGSPLYAEVGYICDKHSINYAGSRTNKGPSYARNHAAMNARNQLILPLDCDDYIHEDTVSILYGEWLRHKKPIIPDVIKVQQDGTLRKHRLYEWSCEAQQGVLALASVSVLHSIEQWKNVGGWDISFKADNLYEDCDYNDRLFNEYCAVNCRQAYIFYRQHPTSRLHSLDNKRERDRILHNRGKLMGKGCCGKTKLANAINPRSGVIMSGIQQQDVASMPTIKDEKVLVQYIGGQGKLIHTYRGPVSKEAHKVSYGDYLYVLPVDAVDSAEQAQQSLFIRVRREEPVVASKKPATTQAVTKTTSTRKPRSSSKKKTPA